MDKQFCHNHPGAAAIADCAKCATRLCGFCARFTDAGIFCETCEKANDTQKFVDTETRKLNTSELDRLVEEAPVESEITQRRSSVSPQTIQVIIILLCVSFVLARVYFLTLPFEERVAPEVAAKEQQLSSLVACLFVFQQIGEQLAAGVTPSPDLRCPGSNVPNIVTRQGQTVRISHPEPQIFGYQALYVSTLEPEPVVVP